eukprot:5895809-Pyramimonas_sp.AAC.1
MACDIPLKPQDKPKTFKHLRKQCSMPVRRAFEASRWPREGPKTPKLSPQRAQTVPQNVRRGP